MDHQTLQNSPRGPTKCHHQQKDVTKKAQSRVGCSPAPQDGSHSDIDLNIDLTVVLTRRHFWSQ